MILAIVVLLLVMQNSSKAQFTTNYSASLGLTTMHIFNDNPAAMPFVTEKDYNGTTQYVYGASYQETQSGYDINLKFPVSKNERFKIPFGIEHIFFRAKEIEHVISGENSHDFLLENKLDLITAYSGVHYVLTYVEDYDISFYGGLELRATVQTANSFIGTEMFKDGTDKIYDLTEKGTAFRIGAGLKLGGEGQIYKNIYANMVFGVAALNLIGNSKSRGEFLTPINEYENNENIVLTYQVAFQLQYKFIK